MWEIRNSELERVERPMRSISPSTPRCSDLLSSSQRHGSARDISQTLGHTTRDRLVLPVQLPPRHQPRRQLAVAEGLHEVTSRLHVLRHLRRPRVSKEVRLDACLTTLRPTTIGLFP